jgi:ribosome-binding protein aMBF1 (putative translation factor)
MTKSYTEATVVRRPRLSETAKEQSTVFERAYGLAVQIAELREKQSLTQAQLAERTGIDQADISRIERGSTHPTEKTLLRIADALGAELRLVEKAPA